MFGVNRAENGSIFDRGVSNLQFAHKTSTTNHVIPSIREYTALYTETARNKIIIFTVQIFRMFK